MADELDKMAAKGDSIAKQYNERRSDRAWYTTMYHEEEEAWNLLPFKEPIATAQIKLNELYITHIRNCPN
jgi:hypothetical protein